MRDDHRAFSRYKGRRIALYGLGAETQKALRELGAHHDIIGLLDSFREEGELYGARILSFDAAVDAGAVLIVVVARPGSCRAIAKRIAERCQKAGIALMDIRGEDLLAQKKVSYHFPPTGGAARDQLREKIREADVVSFDLFDTLVMRRTLYPDDVAEHVDCRLKEKGICIEGFCQRRLASEKELSRGAPPTLAGIYQDMLERMSDGTRPCITAEQLARLEWDIDLGLLVPRTEVCDIFREAVADGRRVYIVSDTYYSQAQLAQILAEICSVTGYAGILSSCEQRTDKARGLFGVLQGSAEGRRFLHVGDDPVADIGAAGQWGMDAYRLPSGVEIFDGAGGLGLAGHVDSLSGRLRTGMFVSRMFNSPFRPEDGRMQISDAYDIGYLLCAPVIGDFVLWFREQMVEGQFGNIWFGARDGYLIKELYGHLLRTLGLGDDTVYFLTSRTAAIRAGVRDVSDIRYVDEMKFSGTLEESLGERFGIQADLSGEEDSMDGSGTLMQYEEAILARSRMEHSCYEKYMDSLDMAEGDIAFFDLVAKGTTQMFIQRMTDHHLRGFYFLQLEKEQMDGKGLEVCSFYERVGTEPCAVYDDYYILEALLTAPHPSVVGFDQDGHPVYAEETRAQEDIRCIKRAQEGILDHFRTYIKLCPISERKVDKGADAVFLDLIHKMRITAPDFRGLMVEDPFFNRMTSITDVI